MINTSRISRVFLLLTLLSAPTLPAGAQVLTDVESSLDGLPVRSITVHGLQRMDEDVVRRRLELRVGEPYRAELARRDERAITGLMIFWSVRIEAGGVPAAEEPSGVEIHIHLEERFAWFAVPQVYWSPEEGWSFGAAAGHFNLLHRGHWLYLTGMTGGASWLSASISNSWNGPNHESFRFGGSTVEIENDLYDFRESGERFNIRLGRWFGRSGRLEGGLDYRRVEGRMPDWTGPVAGEVFTDRLHMVWVMLGQDTSDPWAYPRLGRTASIRHEQFGRVLGGNISGSATRGRITAHAGLGNNFVLAGLGQIDVQSGDVPFWRLLTLGGLNSLRGYELGRYLVSRRWELSGELQWYVLPMRIIDLGVLGDQIVGLSLSVFTDAGGGSGVRRSPGGLSVSDRVPNLVSWGTGIYFHNALFGTLRLEVAWPEHGPRRWGFGLGTKF